MRPPRPLSLVPLLGLLAGAAPAWGQALDGPEALADLALAGQPGLLALAEEEAAARAALAASGRMPDPVLGAEWMEPGHPAPADQLGMTDMVRSLRVEGRQALPLPGMLRAERAAMAAMLPVVAADRDEARLQLAARVHRAWWELCAVQGRRALMQAALGRLDAMAATMRSRFEQGEDPAAALLAVQLARGRMVEDLAAMDRMEAEGRAMLGAALGGPLPELVLPAAPEALPVTGSLAEDLAQALARRPALQGEAAMADQARAEAHMARVQGRVMPMAMAGVELRFQGEVDPMYSVGLETALPFSQGEIARAREAEGLAQARAAEARAAAMRAMLEGELAAARAAWVQAAGRAARTEGELLPLALAARDSRLSAYRVGAGMLDAVLEAEMAVLDLQQAHLQAAVDTRRARVEIGALTGTLLGDDDAP